MRALAKGRDPGDLATLDDPSTLEQIRAILKGWERNGRIARFM